MTIVMDHQQGTKGGEDEVAVVAGVGAGTGDPDGMITMMTGGGEDLDRGLVIMAAGER